MLVVDFKVRGPEHIGFNYAIVRFCLEKFETVHVAGDEEHLSELGKKIAKVGHESRSRLVGIPIMSGNPRSKLRKFFVGKSVR